MNTAIIAEYNPFHNGHALHIKKARELTGCKNIIVIMSGNFVQRGEPAVLEKHIRTRHALLNGADIVLELPVEYAAGAADVFARSAVYIAEKSGIADALCFGAETDDIAVLKTAADILAHEPPEFGCLIKKHSADGLSYPCAREAAYAEFTGGGTSFMRSPNNILALEYLIAINRLKSKILPYAVKREGGAYSDTSMCGSLSSAAAIRAALLLGKDIAKAVPQNTLADLQGAKIPTLAAYSDIISYLLRTTPLSRLAHIADITEGLENRLFAARDAEDVTALISAVKTKRYTHTKISRAVLHILLGITKKMQETPPRYIRVLGVKADKRSLINELAAKSSLPVITRVKENEDLLKTEILAADIYRIATDKAAGSEYTNAVTVV